MTTVAHTTTDLAITKRLPYRDAKSIRSATADTTHKSCKPDDIEKLGYGDSAPAKLMLVLAVFAKPENLNNSVEGCCTIR